MGATATGHERGTPSKLVLKVDRADVDEDVLLDGQTTEVTAVPAQGRFGLGPSGAEIPDFSGYVLLGGTTNLGQRDEARRSGWMAHEAVLYTTSRRGPT